MATLEDFLAELNTFMATGEKDPQKILAFGKDFMHRLRIVEKLDFRKLIITPEWKRFTQEFGVIVMQYMDGLPIPAQFKRREPFDVIMKDPQSCIGIARVALHESRAFRSSDAARDIVTRLRAALKFVKESGGEALVMEKELTDEIAIWER